MVEKSARKAVATGSKEFAETQHLSVLFEEVLEAVAVGDEDDALLFLDCTLGGGGHTEGMLNRFPNSAVVAVDRDLSAIERAKGRLGGLSSRVFFLHGNFADVADLVATNAEQIHKDLGLNKRRNENEPLRFDAVVADLGLSSDQLNCSSRGFSFSQDGPLDMRMDQSIGLTAADILNTFEQRQLTKIFAEGGVGARSRNLAEEVMKGRPWKTTQQFAAACNKVLIGAKRNSGANPATVPFQALRMAVNAELESIDQLLESSKTLIRPGGRLAIICFHSLEDRAVTKTMRVWARGIDAPHRLPVALPSGQLGKLVTTKAVTPAEAEVMANVRSRSARLRVFEFGNEIEN